MHHLRKPVAVALHHGRQGLAACRRRCLQLNGCATQGDGSGGAAQATRLQHILHQTRGAEHVVLQRQLARLHLRRSQHIAHDAKQEAASGTDASHQRARIKGRQCVAGRCRQRRLLRRSCRDARAALQHRGGHEDGVARLAHVMAHGEREGTERQLHAADGAHVAAHQEQLVACAHAGGVAPNGATAGLQDSKMDSACVGGA